VERSLPSKRFPGLRVLADAQVRLHANATTPRTRAYIQQSTASRAARRKAGLDYTLRQRHDPCRKKQDGTVALTYTRLRMVKCRELTA
jgi:hypothetical protein